MDAVALRERLRQEASAIGLDAFGVAPIDADVRADYFTIIKFCSFSPTKFYFIDFYGLISLRQ